MLYGAWLSRCVAGEPRPATPIAPRRKRSKEPKPFAGLTHKPHCIACAHEARHLQGPPPVRPDPMSPTNRRPRQVATSPHCCPHPTCAYRGWGGLGNLRAHGHPYGGPWRQCQGTSCGGYRCETPGTLLHGKRVSVERIVRVMAGLAEGLRQQLALYHVDSHYCLPHASLRLPLPQPEPTQGTGSAKTWRPCTPAMAAGLPAHVWTLRAVLLCRVPPWPQPAGV